MNTSLHDRAWVLKTYMVAQDVIYFQADPGRKSGEEVWRWQRLIARGGGGWGVKSLIFPDVFINWEGFS